jgi:hypothetical protein
MPTKLQENSEFLKIFLSIMIPYKTLNIGDEDPSIKVKINKIFQ